MPHYYIWTIGCQLNQADSQLLARRLEGLGYDQATSMEEADLVMLNSCVVRQSAENRVLSQLHSLRAAKETKPHLALGLTGCLVDSNLEALRQRFPQVDIFFGPQDLGPLEAWARADLSAQGELPPSSPPTPTAFVPVIQGCDSLCTYCIVPYRRGRERSRPVAEIACEVRELVRRGVREVTLLGQNVDAYGHDLPQGPDLADLLGELNSLPGLARLRFLTSHPRYVGARLIAALARLDKVCEHLSLPVQSGDDDILEAMGRGYTSQDYRQLIESLRRAVPGVALSTDVIVGFPGEKEEQFRHTLELVRESRFDTVHVAAYSPRPGTWASRHLRDDVPSSVKRERKRQVEATQQEISSEINSRLLGQEVEVLVEGWKKGRWHGRTRTHKLVFFDHEAEQTGQLVPVRIEKAGPWWLEGGTI